MPKYYFNTTRTHREIDHDGVDLANDASARQYGIAFAGDVMSDEPDLLRDERDFRIEVTDRHHRLLYTIVMQAIDAQPLLPPAAR